MIRNILIHSGWLLITVASFVAGSQLVADRKAAEVSGTVFKTRLNTLESSEYPESEQAPLAFSDNLLAMSPLSQNADNSILEQGGSLEEPELRALALAAIRSATPLERRRAFDRLLKEMESDSFSAELALAVREEMSVNKATGDQWRLFDYAWGKNHPDAAIAYIDEISERFKDAFTGSMLPGLASAHPQRATDLVASMESELRQKMTGRLLEGLVDYDPGFATDYVFGLHRDRDPNARSYMNRLAREMLGDQGFEGGREWAEALPEGTLQGAALVPIAHEYANRDPEGAAQWAEGYIEQNDASRIFGEVVREWGDWRAASTWVESLGESRGQRDALSAVYGFRGATEPHVAVQDIIGMQESPDRDFAINGFISGLAHRDGEAAVIWAAEIDSPGMREEAMVRAARQFFRQDQQAASDWFSNSGLPDQRWTQIAGTR